MSRLVDWKCCDLHKGGCSFRRSQPSIANRESRQRVEASYPAGMPVLCLGLAGSGPELRNAEDGCEIEGGYLQEQEVCICSRPRRPEGGYRGRTTDVVSIYFAAAVR